MIIASASPSTIDAVTKVLSLLAVAAQVTIAVVALAWLLGFVFKPARRLLSGIGFVIGGAELWLAFAVALTAMLGSLFFSELASYVPCRLCWFQRIFMYPLVPLLLALAIRRDRRGSLFYVLPLTAIGSLVSVYHLYIEAHPEAETEACKVGGGSCALKWINEFGYITIPTLSLTASVLIALLVIAAGRAAGKSTRLDVSDAA